MSGAGRIALGAAASVTLLAFAAPAASAAVSLVSVPVTGAAELQRLEATGLDVTDDVSATDASVVLYDADDRATLRSAGFGWRALIPNLRARSAAQRAAEESVAVPTALPSGRSTYRVYEDYVNEINELAETNPEFVRKVTIGESLEGRPIIGLEIAEGVHRSDDGRPAYFQMGLHHAREWPSGEFPMEFAIDLVEGYKAGNERITDLLQSVRTFVIPVVNADGFIASRGSAPSAGGAPVLVGGFNEFRRKNCRPAPDGSDADLPCALRPNSGVDLNRNYGYYWGGPGSSGTSTSESYRGTGPFSEPESEAVHELSSGRVGSDPAGLVRSVQPTVFITNHTFTDQGWWLRQPGVNGAFFEDLAPGQCGGQSPCAVTPDEPAMKALGDSMSAATGWPSDLGWELGDITGATEDWNYFARGLDFHSLYQDMVVEEYEGDASHPGQGIREAFLRAGEEADNLDNHGRIEGSAPPGAILTLGKELTSPTYDQPNVETEENLGSRITVPADGSYEWDVNPSDSPDIPGGPQPDPTDQVWKMTCTRPDGNAMTAPLEVTVARGGTATVNWTGTACAPPAGPNQPPVAAFGYAPASPVAGEPVTFSSASTDSDGAIDATEWDFDYDGSFAADASGLVVTHSFPTAGDHDVALRVSDDDDDSDQEVKTLSVAAGPPPNQPPQATFSVTPRRPDVGEDVVFRSNSGDADGTITSHAWDLDGDGRFDDGLGGEVSRAYEHKGRFQAGLRVTDDRGASDRARLLLIVGEPPPFCRRRSATIVGSRRDDALVGTAKTDVIVAMAGDDVISGRGGRDRICGRRGADVLRGGRGRDLLIGGRGGDRLLGGLAADLLFGNKGADLLLGGGGGDRCRGGRGRDRARGC
jgi:hypothetical protein